MRKQLALIALLTASLAGCAGHTPTEASFNEIPTAAGAKIEVVAEGGIAALSIAHIVRHDDRFYAYSQRRLCTTNCPAPMDSASGVLSVAANDALFTTVLAQSPFSLKDDYGTSRGAADMMEYTIRITANGSTKTIRADDGTMPPQLSQIVNAVRETISAARK